ncbi:dephospho-CoA kinase [Leucobacter luti]|uniref:dephospho-CoA kinase n=1 Tax=Leucobacter luti TaxID=340320 RepID=UPI001C68F29C|nr:dephospho-CoA kinase [Leucobacter luti]QYM76348.1 dephospho-CoA kinase, long form [Leucobacter luti]
MKVIGLTGGIASGKSTIGRRLESLGAIRIDADQLARDAVAPGSPGLACVVSRFGADRVLDERGELDRAALGTIVFEDPEALAALNQIVHPEVRRLYERALADASAQSGDAVVVYEIPLLVEAAREMEFDLVVVADAPADLRVERLVQLRGMAETDARSRIANQASDAERRAVADVLIDTSESEAHTLAQVDALWARLVGD